MNTESGSKNQGENLVPWMTVKGYECITQRDAAVGSLL